MRIAMNFHHHNLRIDRCAIIVCVLEHFHYISIYGLPLLTLTMEARTNFSPTK